MRIREALSRGIAIAYACGGVAVEVRGGGYKSLTEANAGVRRQVPAGYVDSAYPRPQMVREEGVI